MKIIKYNLVTRVNLGSDENPQWEEVLNEVSMPWNEANETIAKAEAHGGQYTVEDDGTPAPAPDRLEQIDAQVTYTAMMTGTLMDGGGAHG